MNCKLLVGIFKKDVASLSPRLAKKNVMHPPIQDKNPVQTRITTIHS